MRARGISGSKFLKSHTSHVNLLALLVEAETPKSDARAIDQSVGDPLPRYDRYLLAYTHAH